MYQSYKILGGPLLNVRPHDFMDDLESFFYVLCHVTFLYDGGNGMRSPSNHPELRKWTVSPESAADSKYAFMIFPGLSALYNLEGLDIGTTHIFGTLMSSLRECFRAIHQSIREAIFPTEVYAFLRHSGRVQQRC